MTPDEFTKAVTAIATATNADLVKQVAEIRNQINSLNSKISALASSGSTQNTDEITSLRADVIALNNRVEAMHNGLSVGHGRINASEHFGGSGQITANEYKRFAAARVDAMSLEQVLEEEARSAGVDPRDTKLFNAWLDRAKPSLLQQASEAQ